MTTSDKATFLPHWKKLSQNVSIIYVVIILDLTASAFKNQELGIVLAGGISLAALELVVVLVICQYVAINSGLVAESHFTIHILLV